MKFARLLFIVASLVLIVTPGQDMILVMSRSIGQVRAVTIGLGVRLALERRT